ncbi:MAG: tetratricopeptide repeat protein [Planctomycetaceae bacterium]
MTNRYRNTTLTLLGLTGLVLVVGCQWSGRSGGLAARRAGATPGATADPAALSNQQVADMHLALGRTLEQQKEYERALDAYAKAAELDPHLAAAVWRQGVVFDKQGRVRESEACYRQALKLSPKDPDLLCDYGYSLYLQRRWAEAEGSLRKAVAEAPRHQRSHCNLGLVLAQTERTTEALAEFQQAGCDTSAAQANLGLVLAMNNRLPAAKAAYAQALAAKPKSVAARRGMELIARVEQRGERTSALQLASHDTVPGQTTPRVAHANQLAPQGQTLVVPAAATAEPAAVLVPAAEETEPTQLDSHPAEESLDQTTTAPTRLPAIHPAGTETETAGDIQEPASATSSAPAPLPAATPRGVRPRVKRIVK